MTREFGFKFVDIDSSIEDVSALNTKEDEQRR